MTGSQSSEKLRSVFLHIATRYPRPAVDSSLRRIFARLQWSFFRPTQALPLDVFRIAVGVLSFAYFVHTFLETGDFSSPSGLIDHDYSLKMF